MSPRTLFFKFYSEAFLYGKIRSILKPSERSVWIDFNCLASLGDGFVEIFDRNATAKQLLVPRKVLDKTIEKLIEHGTIVLEPQTQNEQKNEKYHINGWETEQGKYLHKRNLDEKSDADRLRRGEERREEEIKEENSREEEKIVEDINREEEEARIREDMDDWGEESPF
jgi:hypothetical protein